MNYFEHLLRSKGAANALRRAVLIYRRFDFTSEKILEALESVVKITRAHGCVPTFFVTAVLLDHHGEQLATVLRDYVQVGLHGHHHVDHALQPGDIQRREIERGVQKLRKHGIEVMGFRAPFLRFNEETGKAVADNHLSWVSHSAILFNESTFESRLKECESVRLLTENFYSAESFEGTPSLPIGASHCLDIPASLPDDEILLDRVRIHDAQELTGIWTQMLEVSHRQGELFNLVIHPERMDSIAESVDQLLEQAVRHGDVWLNSLDAIAQWWKERSAFSFKIGKAGADTYRVGTVCSDRASVLVQHPGGERELIKPGQKGEFLVRSRLKPVISVPPDASEETRRWMIDEGFLLDHDEDPSQCAFALSGTPPKNRRELLSDITGARGPLVRFWRWPEGYQSALAVSLDLDALTRTDFVRRIGHFRKAEVQ